MGKIQKKIIKPLIKDFLFSQNWQGKKKVKSKKDIG